MIKWKDGLNCYFYNLKLSVFFKGGFKQKNDKKAQKEGVTAWILSDAGFIYALVWPTRKVDKDQNGNY